MPTSKRMLAGMMSAAVLIVLLLIAALIQFNLSDHSSKSSAGGQPVAVTPLGGQPVAHHAALQASCTWSNVPWQSTKWGRAKFCPSDFWYEPFAVMTQDILTDGWCVHVDYKTTDGLWYTVDGSTSCGSQVVSWPGAYNARIVEVRLIRGPSTWPYRPGVGVNYLTVWP